MIALVPEADHTRAEAQFFKFRKVKVAQLLRFVQLV